MPHKKAPLIPVSPLPLLLLILLLIALPGLSPAAEIPCEWTGVEKIIAVGDLHGDYDNFVLILKDPKVALVDENLHWIGGKTHLVQTGDILDRGDKAKEILELLMRLEGEAEAAGGKVHFLFGNHEEATVTGISLDYPDYVSPKQFVSFLPEGYRKAREKQYLSRLPDDEKARVQALGGDLDKNPSLLNFWTGVLSNVRKRNDQLAALAYVENFNATYRKWFLQKNCVIKINDIIFVHGGINLAYSNWKIKDINDVFRMELYAYALNPTAPRLGGEPFTPKLVYNPQSPLWYRQDDTASQEEIDQILANLGASRMVVGHNFLAAAGGSPIVLQGDAVARFEGKVWMIDTGIGYTDLGGILYALIIDHGNFDFYTGSAEPAAQSSSADPTNDGPETPEEIEEFLKTATPLLVVPGSAGRTEPWRVKMESGGIIRWAQFKYINRPRPGPISDSFNYEIAAYELDKYLGLGLVPPAVPRTINDTPGSLQMFIENAIRESDRKRENIHPADPEAFNQAMADLRVFENLVYDVCGNDRDTFIQKETGKVYRVDFSEAFAPENGTIPGCEILSCSRRLYQRLRDWDREKVTTLLSPYLNEEEVQAVHVRRGSIVRMIQEQIELRGENDVLFYNPREVSMNSFRIKPWFSILALLVTSGMAPGAPANGTFTLEQVLSAPYPSDLVSAKSVDRIAWVFNSEGARNIWTAAGPDYAPVNLTGYTKDEVFEIQNVEITVDGSVVVFVRGGDPDSRGWVTNPTSDPDGVEQAIWAVRTDGGNPWRVCAGSYPVLSPDGRWILVTKDNLIYRVPLRDPSAAGQEPEPELLFKAAGRNGRPVWSPDQTRVAFVSSREEHSFVGVYDLAKRKLTWLAPSVDRDSEPAWSPDGKSVAFFRRPGAQYNEVFDYFNPPIPAIWVADAVTGLGRELWNPPAADPKYYTIRNPMWTARNRILFTAEHDEWNHVFSLAPEGGGEPEDLTPGDGMVEHLALSSDGGTLFYSSNQADIHGRHIFKVAAAGSGSKAVPLIKGADIGCYPVALASGKDVAFLYATAKHPMSVALVPAAGGKTQVIAPRALPEKFPLNDLVVPELVIVKAPDGLEIPCQLFLPKGAKPGERRPGIVFTHGGPIRQMLLGWHYMEFYSEAYGINQYFANRGYVVISINYRSGIGYGRRFRMPPNAGRRGASEYQDVVAGAKYLQARPEVDPERVGLWGLSYGGLLTAQGLARNSDIFKAGVDLAGVHDWSAREREPHPWAQTLSAEDRKLAFDSSPVAFVNTWKSPVLFIHGDDDRNVDFSQTVDLVQKLRAKGDVHIELMVRPDEPHEFMLHKNRMDGYHATFEFLDRFLGKK